MPTFEGMEHFLKETNFSRMWENMVTFSNRFLSVQVHMYFDLGILIV